MRNFITFNNRLTPARNLYSPSVEVMPWYYWRLVLNLLKKNYFTASNRVVIDQYSYVKFHLRWLFKMFVFKVATNN